MNKMFALKLTFFFFHFKNVFEILIFKIIWAEQDY